MWRFHREWPCIEIRLDSCCCTELEWEGAKVQLGITSPLEQFSTFLLKKENPFKETFSFYGKIKTAAGFTCLEVTLHNCSNLLSQLNAKPFWQSSQIPPPHTFLLTHHYDGQLHCLMEVCRGQEGTGKLWHQHCFAKAVPVNMVWNLAVVTERCGRMMLVCIVIFLSKCLHVMPTAVLFPHPHRLSLKTVG